MGTRALNWARWVMLLYPCALPHSVFSAPDINCSNHSSCTSLGYFIKSSIWWIRFFMNQVNTELKMVIGYLIGASAGLLVANVFLFKTKLAPRYTFRTISFAASTSG